MYLAREVQLISSTATQGAISALGGFCGLGSDGLSSTNNALPLSALRAQSAWILLGEPGAGKTTAFKHEAHETGGKYYTLAEFLHLETEPIDPEASLFIDALDEHREQHSRQVLLAQVATKLKQLGSPKFRIACRAADWWQSVATHPLTDSLTNTLPPILLTASRNDTLSLFNLLPLSETAVRQLIEAELAADCRQELHKFVNSFTDIGLGHLLTNPQTLQLLVKAWAPQQSGQSETPLSTKAQIYELACTQLAREVNPIHRDLQARLGRAYTTEQLLDMAGYLCAALIPSGYEGVSLNLESLDFDQNSTAFAHIDNLQPTDMNLALQAVCSRLFQPTMSSPEHTNKTSAVNQHPRFEPAHRSIAEYLAARWLNNQINRHGMPRHRLIGLLTGFDGKAISSLRGIYGWLAQINVIAQNQLIRKDPICVLLNTDLASTASQTHTSAAGMCSLVKVLFSALREEALKDPAPFWYLQGSAVGLFASSGGLAGLGQAILSQPDIYEQLLDDLTNPSRDDHHQTWVTFVLRALLATVDHNTDQRNNRPTEHLAKPERLETLTLAVVLRDITLDPSRWEGLRKLALHTWLALTSPQEAGVDTEQHCAKQHHDTHYRALELLQALHSPAATNLANIARASNAETEPETSAPQARLTQTPALDPNLELTGILLGYLYPATIPSSEIVEFCHLPVTGHFGSYQSFWALKFPGLIPESDLPLVMDELTKRQDLKPTQWDAFELDRMLATVMRRALATHSNQITAEQLYDWLQLGQDQYGQRWNQPHCNEVVHFWLNQQRQLQTDRYKELLQVAYSRSLLQAQATPEIQGTQDGAPCSNLGDFSRALFDNTRFLQTVAPPHDIGAWHLDQVERLTTQSDEASLVQITEHLRDAIQSLWDEQIDTVGDNVVNATSTAANRKKVRARSTPKDRHRAADKTKSQTFKQDLLERLASLARRYRTVGDLMQGPLQPLMSCVWAPKSLEPGRNPNHTLQHPGASKQAEQLTDRIAREREARTHELAKRLLQLPPEDVHPLLLNQLARLWTNDLPGFTGQDRRMRFAQYSDNPDETMQAAQAALIACVTHADLPSAAQILAAVSNNQHYPIGKACLVGMDLLHATDHPATDLNYDPELTDQTLASLICWQLLDESRNQNAPGWFIKILAIQTELVADVLSRCIITQLKAFADHVAGVDQLTSDWRYGSIAPIVISAALKAFPVRHKAKQLPVLRQLIRGALEHCPEDLLTITQIKLQQKSPLPSQRVYWLLAATLLQAQTYETKLWAFVGTNWERAAEIGLFFEESNRWVNTPFSAFKSTPPTKNDARNKRVLRQPAAANDEAARCEITIAKVIELLIPKADVEIPLGITEVTPAMRLGDTVRHLIRLLGELGTQTAVAELGRLINVLGEAPIRHALQSARHKAVTILRDEQGAARETVRGPVQGSTQRLGLREAGTVQTAKAYRRASPPGALLSVVRALKHLEPANVADLQATVLDLLAEIQDELQHGDTNAYKLFWRDSNDQDQANGKTNTQRHLSENDCRDALMSMLKPRLAALGIGATREHLHRQDKRSDIQLGVGNEFSIPIEIKGEWDQELWTAARDQLKVFYNDPRKTNGYGIYLVFWVGGHELAAVPGHLRSEFAIKPATSAALQAMLQADLNRDLGNSVEVSVLDVGKVVAHP